MTFLKPDTYAHVCITHVCFIVKPLQLIKTSALRALNIRSKSGSSFEAIPMQIMTLAIVDEKHSCDCSDLIKVISLHTFITEIILFLYFFVYC